jgi:tetratricopeptide (TPR) repeat protein
MKIGVSYANVGDVRGLEFLRAAEDELNPETQLEDLVSALSWIGRYYHYQAQHRQAINSFMNALEMVESSELYIVKCTLYAFLSGTYQHLLEPEQSGKWAYECLSLTEKHEDPYWIAVGYEFLSENQTSTGHWNEAIDSGLQDNIYGEKIGSLERVGWSKLCQAEPLHNLGRLDEALKIGRSGLDLADQIGEHRLSSLLLSLLSKIAADLDDDKLAENYARQAIKKADDLNQVLMQCKSRQALIYLLVKQEKWEEALKHCEEGKELYLPTENVFAQSEIQIVTPSVLLGSGQLAEANNEVGRILQLASDHKKQPDHGIALRIKGQIQTATRDFESAAHTFQKSIEILAGLDCQLELGRAYYHRGMLLKSEKQIEPAKLDLEKALNYFNKSGATHDQRITQDLIASLE